VTSPELLAELERLDVATYAAVARTQTPSLDAALARVSQAADKSKLWFAVAGVLALSGSRGRRAAAEGLASIGVTSAVVNLGIKPLWRRSRPDRTLQEVPEERQVPMPGSTSFPSGHAASAFAFATAVTDVWPGAGIPVRMLAALVAYSRIHTGVHYPGDVIAGSLIGGTLAQFTTHAIDRRRAR